MQVLKFGGASISSPEAMVQAAEIICSHKRPTVVVVSAIGGVTDSLVAAANAASQGDISKSEAATFDFRRRYLGAIDTLISDHKYAESLRLQVEESASEFKSICQSIYVLKEVTPRILDVAVARGERMAAKLIAAILEEKGVKVAYRDATEIISVVKRQGTFVPNFGACAMRANQLLSAKDSIYVVPGFIAEGPNKQLVTLGRGGSDYSASIIAGALGASSVTLYKDVAGLLTADPRYVEDARIIERLHYREAAELAYYGAKILHPRTIIPLVDKSIPLIIKKSSSPDEPGTTISNEDSQREFPVKALTAMTNQAIIAVEGKGMVGLPGIAAKTFFAMANAGISVSVISQASSEASICFVVSEEQSQLAVETLQEDFRFELEQGQLDNIRCDRGIAVVAIVGLGMKGLPGIAARALGAMGRSKINVEAIAQGSSELNISMAIKESQVKKALIALHNEFRLEKLKPLYSRSENYSDIVVFGLGKIGRSLIEQINSQDQYFKNQMGIGLRTVSLIDSREVQVEPQGFGVDQLTKLKQSKAESGRMSQLPALERGQVSKEITDKVLALTLDRGIFVDLTAEESDDLVLSALKEGFNVVLANKKPLSVPSDRFHQLFEQAKSRGLMLRYEATVGAGLPVLDTLAKLKSAGDEVISISGCLSGTLGYLMSELEKGVSYSSAVKSAFDSGYTEPHPREDLSGMDVARKALILARSLGREINIEELEVEKLYRDSSDSDDPATFVANLVEMDEEIEAMVAKARSEGKVLRYVANIAGEGVEVGVKAVSIDSPLGRLQGTDNQIVITTKRYSENPLVVTGPGAGVEVTAAGVLNDIIAITTAQKRH